MGIHSLNTFIKINCPEAIKNISFADLKNKKIVVDTSIYMYRFLSENALIDKMYQMIILFKHNNIIPVFVFDGKPPPEKQFIINKRREEKYNAELKFNLLNKQLKESHDSTEIKELENEMDLLKKKFVRLSFADIENVKQLMNLCGVTYYQAEGEADKLCAKLVVSNEVYACLSEDNDMFVYGCHRVLKYISLLNNTFVVYDLSILLQKLNMSLFEFKQICVLSGTDYNSSKNNDTINMTIFTALIHFKKYKDYSSTAVSMIDFYDWLNLNANEHQETVVFENENNNVDLLNYTLDMFDVSTMNINIFLKVPIKNTDIKKNELHLFLDKYNFIFP